MTAAGVALIDQDVRHRFETELERNFSVIAPAGVGKTEAIVRRVIQMASANPVQARQWLAQLVVVTYTNRAANEMQHRARNEILRRGVDPHILHYFNQAFFGTIHQFCFKLLRQHGSHLGLPGDLEVVTDEGALWLEFVRSTKGLGAWGGDGSSPQESLLRHLSALQILEAGRRMRALSTAIPPAGPYPELDFRPLLSFPPNPRSRGGVERGQATLRRWMEQLKQGLAPLAPPAWNAGGREFENLWTETFRPLHEWIGNAAAAAAVEIARQFRQYRLSKGLLTFDDQVAMAAQLVVDPVAGGQLREEGFRVILDEAQDTDPEQFKVLLELARPPGASGDWLETGNDPPRAGHFCMVGDLQQSIYGERADLDFYRRVHERLKSDPQGEQLIFSVTFRCDQRIIEAVNGLAARMLDGQDGQVNYVPLKPRPDVGPGQVIRLPIARPDSLAERAGVDLLAAEEAAQLAAWIREQGLSGLRAPCWSEVAILCPRKRWMTPFCRALRKVGLKYQIQSARDVMGDSPAYAWFTALLVCLAQPNNHFEIVGVLREVFGLSDQQLADYCEGNGALFQIETALGGEGPVADTLNLLARLRQEALSLPLRDAVVRLVEAVGLEARLRLLPDYPADLLAEELDGLLLQTAAAEAQGLTLQEWAEELRSGFLQLREEETVQQDCIQLLTCQKAKGLQWHAVILPGFYREIRGGRTSYPVVIYPAHGQPPLIAFDRSGVSGDLKQLLKRRESQELQRILYVAMTRARNTLVLPDSSLLYPERGDSFAQLLRLSDPQSQAIWEALPRETIALPLSPEKREAQEQALPLLEPLTFNLLEQARRNAEQFARRVLPSHLVEHGAAIIEEPENRREIAEMHEDPIPWQSGETARDYGAWWHQLMERLDWAQPVEGWERIFEAHWAHCPQPQRAREEWSRFLGSWLVKHLGQADWIVHQEMPLLVRQDNGNCLEGFVDLAALDPVRQCWLIVDYKTDRVGEDQGEVLVERYRPQIQAYMEALKTITGLPCEGALYSTSTGLWLRV